MTRFSTRVELHDATSENYEKLHAEMKKRGFDRTIKAEGALVIRPVSKRDQK